MTSLMFTQNLRKLAKLVSLSEIRSRSRFSSPEPSTVSALITSQAAISLSREVTVQNFLVFDPKSELGNARLLIDERQVGDAIAWILPLLRHAILATVV
jgi:hypothetical protein